LAPNTCCQGAQVYPPWSASAPACAGLTSPSPTCNNLAIDAANCGSCGAACPASTANTIIGCCSGVCKDFFSDDNNCGTCGNVCASQSKCESGQCATCLPATYIYGIADNKVIYETNVKAGTNRAVFDAKPFIAPGDPNAFAYDTARDDFFFLDSAKTLWYWNRQTPVLTQIATAPQMGINGFTLPANAVYYNNGFWFIKEGGPAVTQQTLIQIVFTYNANQNPVYSATKTYTFNIVNSNNQPTAVAVSLKEREGEREAGPARRRSPRPPRRWRRGRTCTSRARTSASSLSRGRTRRSQKRRRGCSFSRWSPLGR
jgi:hypothetical protein